MEREPGASGQSHDLFHLIVENVRDYAIFMVDPDGIIISWNPGVAGMFGFAEDEFIGQPTSVVFIQEDVERGEPYKELVKAAADGRCEDRRWHRRKDGSRFWANGLMMAIRDEAGELRAFAKITRDETEHKRLEDEIARANRLKDEFLATLSHELRTPLTAVLGWVRLLRGGDLDQEMVTSALETIERNALAQSQLIEDILDISRIISGKLFINYSPVELTDVLDSVIESARPASQAKGLHWEIAYGSAPVIVSGDAGRLRQVIWNLISNALKFTPAGGRITVTLQGAANHADIIIRDTGRGIKPDFLPFVFDRFAQEDTGTRRHQGGLGIGLSLVRHLTELHGGSVSVHSDGEGRGASFTIRLPLLHMRPVAEVTGADVPVRYWPPSTLGLLLHGLRIVVVDDEEDARALIATILQQQGAEPVPCSSAAEALDAIAEARPDAIVSDIGMPDRNGYDLIRIIRKQPEDQSRFLPAMAVSAYVGSDTRMSALVAGFQMFMAKPVDPSELVASLVILTGRTGDG